MLGILFYFSSSCLYFQRILITLLTSGDEDHSAKDCVSLFQTIGTLAQKLSNTSAAVGEMQNWFLRILKEQAIGEAESTLQF